MAFKFSNLEDYLKKNSKGKQPVGSSVNPLGNFAAKPIQQDIKPRVDYPAAKIEPWDFEANHPAKDGVAAETGKPHTTGDKAFGIKGPDALGKMPIPNIEGKPYTTGDKAFQIPGDDHEGRKGTPKLEGMAHTTKYPNKPFKFKPIFTTGELGKQVEGPEHSTQEPIKPRSAAPDYPTQNTIPRSSAPDYSTQEPINRPDAPDYSTQEPISRPGAPDYSTLATMPRPGAPDYSTQEPIKTQYNKTHKLENLAPSKDGALLELLVNTQYKDRKELFGSSTGDKITHLNNNQSNYLRIEGDPGNMMFKFGTPDDKVPAGGSSIWTHTRLGGPESMGVKSPAYYKKFSLVRQGDSVAGPKEINYDGNSVPVAATWKRANLLTDKEQSCLTDAAKEGLYGKVGKNKFVSLRDEAQRNNPRSPMWMKAPLIQRGIQKGPGNENPKSPGFLPSLDPVNGAIGLITSPLIDTLRVGKYLISPDGLVFMAKQVGLQLTNPRSEWKLGLHRGRIFNPLAFALQVPANVLGIHMDRHWLGPLNGEDSKYEKLISDNNANTPQNTLDGDGPSASLLKGTNRLVGMLDEMSCGILGIGKTPGSKIDMLSGLMGPKSFFGIGQTRFFKHTSGRDVFFDDKVEPSGLELYEPETPYVKGLAHGGEDGVSEAQNQGAQGILVPFAAFDPNFVGYSREDFDEYWANKAEDEVNFPTNLDMNGPKGEGNGIFNTMDYSTIGYYRRNKKMFRDFRQIDGEWDEENMYDGEGRTNIITRLGLVDWGAYSPGAGAADGEIHDFYEGEEANDYVKVTFCDPDDENKVYLRAYNLEISDKLKPSYSSVAYSGNPAESHVFDKIGRSWTLKLTLAAFTTKELLNNYKKLNAMMQLASPKVMSKYAGGHITKMNVGSIWKDMPIIITSIDYEINDEAGWDIGHGKEEGWNDGTGHAETTKKELPMMFNLSVGGEFLANADGNLWTNESNFFQDSIMESE